jgi:hypothetical protein
LGSGYARETAIDVKKHQTKSNGLVEKVRGSPAILLV